MRSLCDFLYLSLPYPRERRVPDATLIAIACARQKRTGVRVWTGLLSQYKMKTLLRTHTENDLKCRIREYRINAEGIMTVTTYRLAVFCTMSSNVYNYGRYRQSGCHLSPVVGELTYCMCTFVLWPRAGRRVEACTQRAPSTNERQVVKIRRVLTAGLGPMRVSFCCSFYFSPFRLPTYSLLFSK